MKKVHPRFLAFESGRGQKEEKKKKNTLKFRVTGRKPTKLRKKIQVSLLLHFPVNC